MNLNGWIKWKPLKFGSLASIQQPQGKYRYNPPNSLLLHSPKRTASKAPWQNAGGGDDLASFWGFRPILREYVSFREGTPPKFSLDIQNSHLLWKGDTFSKQACLVSCANRLLISSKNSCRMILHAKNCNLNLEGSCSRATRTHFWVIGNQWRL